MKTEMNTDRLWFITLVVVVVILLALVRFAWEYKQQQAQTDNQQVRVVIELRITQPEAQPEASHTDYILNDAYVTNEILPSLRGDLVSYHTNIVERHLGPDVTEHLRVPDLNDVLKYP